MDSSAAVYCCTIASQGAGRVGFAMIIAVLRVIIAAGGGFIAVTKFGGSTGLFVALAVAMVFYGVANAGCGGRGACSSGRPNPKAVPAAQPS